MTQQKSSKSAKPSARATRTSRKAEPPSKHPIELIIWIVLLGIFGGYSFIGALLQLGSAGLGAVIGVVTGGFVLAFAVGLWFWQRWAYFGILIAFSLVIVIALAAGAGRNFGSLLVAAVIMFVTVALVQPRFAQFR